MIIVSRWEYGFERQVKRSFSSQIAANGVVLKKRPLTEDTQEGETNRNVSNSSQVK